MKIRLFAMIAVALLPTSAVAGWQWTEWGMTPEVVIEALPAGTELFPSETPRELNAVHLAAGVEFIASMEFTDQGLASVTLTPLGGECDDFELSLAAAFGAPVTEGADAITWIDRESGNTVEISYLTANSCRVVYSPTAQTDGF